LRLTGVDGDGELAVHGAADFPTVRLARLVEPVEPDSRHHFRITHASFSVGNGRVLVEREPATATMRSPVPLEEAEVVHPWLSRVGGMFGHWLGRDVLHGGAFTAGGGAWAVLGSSEAGKSTLLAELAGAGYEVVADDTLVIGDGLVYAGPRCIDLRPDAATVIGARDTRPCRGGTRLRLRLAPALAAVPLVGVVHLTWGQARELRRVEAARRIELLRAASWLGPLDPIDKHTLLHMAALPTHELVRPRRFDARRETVATLRGAVGD
jgi:hypothetical protein